MKAMLRPWLAIAAVTVVALGTAGTVGATVDTVGGQMEKIAAPPSVELGVLESDTTMRTFDEQQCVTLADDLTVDINAPGRYDSGGDLPRPKPAIPAGTLVSSHLIHADSVSGTPQNPIILQGRITTDEDILGITIENDTLNDSDVLGAPGTTYPKANRALNFGQDDFVVEQENLRTVVVRAENHTHIDSVRVITKCTKKQEKCKISGIGVLANNYKAGFAFLVETSKPSGAVLFADAAAKKTLTSSTITSVDLVGSTATIKGTGKAGNSNVPFTIVVTDNGSNDTFSISWPGYSTSGGVKKGGIFICCP
jgi:hypothetical protein